MASRTSIWRSISWSKKDKTKSQNKDSLKIDTALANTSKNSTTDPLTPPSNSQAISPRTGVDTNRRVRNESPITPPESPYEPGFGDGHESGDGDRHESEDGDGHESGDGEGSNGSSGSSQEIQKPFRRSVDRNIRLMVEGRDEPSTVSEEWAEEVGEASEQGDGEIEEEGEGKSGEKKERRSWRRSFWRGIAIWKGKGEDKCGVVGKGDDGSPSGLVQFNTVKWGPKGMGGDEGREKEKEKKGKKQRSKSDGQAKRPKTVEERGKEEISLKRRWTIPGFRKAEEIKREPERLEEDRKRKEERQKRNIEHKKKYPQSVLDDIKDEYNDYKEIASTQLDELVQAGKNLEAEAKAKAKAKELRPISRLGAQKTAPPTINTRSSSRLTH